MKHHCSLCSTFVVAVDLDAQVCDYDIKLLFDTIDADGSGTLELQELLESAAEFGVLQILDHPPEHFRNTRKRFSKDP